MKTKKQIKTMLKDLKETIVYPPLNIADFDSLKEAEDFFRLQIHNHSLITALTWVLEEKKTDA